MTEKETLEKITERVRRSYGPLKIASRPHAVEQLTHGLPRQAVVEQVERLFQRVADEAGDGCWTAVLIAVTTALVAEERAAGSQMAEAIRQAAHAAADHIPSFSMAPRTPEQVLRVSTTAALGSRELGEALVEAFATVGPNGAISIVRDSPGAGNSPARIAVSEGPTYPLSVRLPAAKAEAMQLRRPLILVAATTLGEADVAGLLDASLQASRPCLCFCAGLEPAAQSLLEWHRRQRSLEALAVLPSSPLHWLAFYEDVAVLTGASVLSDGDGPLQGDVLLHYLGSADRVVLEEQRVVIDGGSGSPERIESHAADLREQLLHGADETARQPLAERLARLLGAWAEVVVCGASPQETEVLYDLAAGALHQGRRFIAEGGVPGGGAAYLRCADYLEGEAGIAGSEGGRWAMAAGLKAPLRCLIEQAELPEEETLAALRKDRSLCLDVCRKKLVPWAKEGPLEAAAIAQTVVSLAGETAARLVESGISR